MEYLVNITARAARDLSQIYREKNADTSDAALRWYRGLRQTILSLREHPNRCPITAENSKLRHLLYGDKPDIYRILYRIVEKKRVVEVLHIRHGAQRRFRASDL